MDLIQLIKKLQEDQDYHSLETHEVEFKAALKKLFRDGDLNEIVQKTLMLGLLLKYKPYGVKCSTVLGYSIFLLNQDEGFSFQRHIDFKTELFHCIKAYSGGYAFIAENADFAKMIKDSSIENWWKTGKGEFSRFAKPLISGDVIKVERPGIVHTVIGCIIEEYANTSVDMVDRLFDQNKGRITPILNREKILEKLSSSRGVTPGASYQLENGSLHKQSIQTHTHGQGVLTYQLHESPEFSAMRMILNPGSKSEINTENQFVSLFSFNGSITINALSASLRSLKLVASGSVILPPGTKWAIENAHFTDLSVLKIDKELAFL